MKKTDLTNERAHRLASVLINVDTSSMEVLECYDGETHATIVFRAKTDGLFVHIDSEGVSLYSSMEAWGEDIKDGDSAWAYAQRDL